MILLHGTILWRIEQLLSGDFVNKDRFWARNDTVTVGNTVFLRGPC
jgi:hypothetical protein